MTMQEYLEKLANNIYNFYNYNGSHEVKTVMRKEIHTIYRKLFEFSDAC